MLCPVLGLYSRGGLTTPVRIRRKANFLRSSLPLGRGKFRTLEDDFYMRLALKQASQALARGDVPVGALLVRKGEILASGSDAKSIDPTAHAEINAIREACLKSGSWNLSGCTLYVTLEPCPMCAGACVNSRVSRVVFGAKNAKSGAGGTLYNILSDSRLNHVCEVRAGVLGRECLEILQGYFLRRRKAGRL